MGSVGIKMFAGYAGVEGLILLNTYADPNGQSIYVPDLATGDSDHVTMRGSDIIRNLVHILCPFMPFINPSSMILTILPDQFAIDPS